MQKKTISSFFGKLMALAILLPILAACSSTVPFPSYSGFLGDYRGMYRSNTIPGLVLVDYPGRSIVDYKKFFVEPVSTYMTPEAKGHSLDPATLKKYADVFYQDLRTSLARNYTVVDVPGAGVVRIRAAITEIELSSSGVLQKGSVEIDFRDSETNKRVLAIVDSRKVESFSWWADTLTNRLNELHKKTILVTSGAK